jgi:hypothetical protein
MAYGSADAVGEEGVAADVVVAEEDGLADLLQVSDNSTQLSL